MSMFGHILAKYLPYWLFLIIIFLIEKVINIGLFIGLDEPATQFNLIILS